MYELHEIETPPAFAGKPSASDDADLLERVLQPYKPHCRYVHHAAVHQVHDAGEGPRLVARGEFGIADSCYIDDTGHFNSVEFNICYNQLVYFAIAKAVDEQVFEGFAGWRIDDFWRKQLPDILITRFESCFHKPVLPRSFHGEVSFGKPRSARAKMLLLRTSCRFWDDHGGRCDGHVALAVLNGVHVQGERQGAPASAPASPGLAALQATARAARAAALADQVRQQMRTVLQTAGGEALADDCSFFDLGFTSLGIEELKQRLEEHLGCRIEAEVLFKHPTLQELVAHLRSGPLAHCFDVAAAAPEPAASCNAPAMGTQGDTHEQALAGQLLARLLRD